MSPFMQGVLVGYLLPVVLLSCALMLEGYFRKIPMYVITSIFSPFYLLFQAAKNRAFLWALARKINKG